MKIEDVNRKDLESILHILSEQEKKYKESIKEFSEIISNQRILLGNDYLYSEPLDSGISHINFGRNRKTNLKRYIYLIFLKALRYNQVRTWY